MSDFTVNGPGKIKLTSPDGSALYLVPHFGGIHRSKAPNIPAASIVYVNGTPFFVKETPEEIEEIVKTTYVPEPVTAQIKEIANLYGLVLIEQDLWTCVFGFGTNREITVKKNLRSNDLNDAISKIHMELSLKYSEAGIKPEYPVVTESPPITMQKHARETTGGGCCG